MAREPVRVLVVDDDPDWLTILTGKVEAGLAAGGFDGKVEQHQEFLPAYQALSEQDWNLLVTDMALKDDCTDTLGMHLVEKAQERGIPRIVVSGPAPGSVIYEIESHYGAAFVHKKYFRELPRKVIEVLDSPDPAKIRPSRPLPRRDQLFLCYAREDEEWMQRLRRHLEGARLEERIWCDHDIKSDEKWDAAIRDAIERSCVTVMLLSEHFLSSDYINGVELPLMLELAQSGAMRLTWVAVRPSVVRRRREIWELQCLNSPSRSLSQLEQDSETAEELRCIAEKIIDLVEETRRRDASKAGDGETALDLPSG